MKMGWRKNYVRQRGYFLNVIREYKERTDIRVYLEILLSLLTISVFAVFALRPTLLTIAELLKEIDAKKTTLATMDLKIGNLTNAQILFDQNVDKIELLKSSIPDYPQPDVVLRQFEGITGTNGVVMVNLTFDEAPLKGDPPLNNDRKKTDIKRVENSLPVKSNFLTEIENYGNSAKLINNFENLRLPFNINQLTITTALQDDKQVLLINMDGYFLFNERVKSQE